MEVKTQVPLIMMVAVLCASAGASTAGRDGTLVADEVGVYAYPPVLSPAGHDDDSLVADDEAAQYATTPAPSSEGIEGSSIQPDDVVGLYAPAPAPISTGLDDDTLFADEAALYEDALSAAAPASSSTGLDGSLLAPSPSAGQLEDTQPQQADEVTPAAAPLQASLLADTSSVAETESIQKIIDVEGCIYEIITFANYKMGEEEKVGPACCKVVEDIVNNKNWPNIFPFNPAFPHKIKGYCTQYVGGSPASAPTTSYAPCQEVRLRQNNRQQLAFF